MLPRVGPARWPLPSPPLTPAPPPPRPTPEGATAAGHNPPIYTAPHTSAAGRRACWLSGHATSARQRPSSRLTWAPPRVPLINTRPPHIRGGT